MLKKYLQIKISVEKTLRVHGDDLYQDLSNKTGTPRKYISIQKIGTAYKIILLINILDHSLG